MSKIPAISIITPVWNGYPFIKECVESVLSQKFQDWELIVSDNGSSDETPGYLNTLTDPRIKVYRQETNLGIFGNLNFLFTKATAPITQILCADDYFINESSLTQIVGYWNNVAPFVGFARFNHKNVSDRRLTGFQKKVIPSVIPPAEGIGWFYIFGNLAGNLSNMSLRTSIVSQLGGFTQTLPYSGDFEFWARASEVVGMGISDLEAVYVRRHAGVASSYLNRKGELIAQNALVVSGLYKMLIQRYPREKFALQLHGTLCYDTSHRDTAVRLLLKGDTNYLKELKKAAAGSAHIMNWFMRWAIFMASLGGRIGTPASANFLIRSIKSDVR